MRIDFVRAFSDNYIWLLIDDEQKSVLCVDPGEAAPVIKYLKNNKLQLKALLITHHHADHCGGLPGLLQHYPQAEIYGPKDARIPVDVENINDAPKFPLQGYHFQTIKIPGHTSTHICFYESKVGVLFSGDTLFSAGCGRVFDGSLELLYESLMRLKALPENTKVYCEHEYTRKNLQFALQVEPDNSVIQAYSAELAKNPEAPSLPSSVRLEKQINPFLRLEEPGVIQYAKERGCQDLDAFSVFKQLRMDKDNF